MSQHHADQSSNASLLDHDSIVSNPSKIPSKSSQPPIDMAPSLIPSYDIQTYYIKKYRQTVASAPACALSVLAGAPFENVKTRMQSKDFTSALHATRYTYRTEGIRGFWVGTYAPLVSLTASRALGFSIYRKAKYALDGWIETITGTSPLQHVNRTGTYPTVYTFACFTGAGMISGGLVAVVLAPVELVKNAAQTSVLMANQETTQLHKMDKSARKNVGRVSSIDAVRQIVRARGVLGLYTGFRLHLVRDLVGTGIYFGVYEAVKQSLNSYYGAEKANSPGAVAFAGATCGVFAWAVTYPLDTMKTQAQNRLVGANALSAKDAAAVAASSAGKQAARLSRWKGFEMIILRSAVQNMIQMSFFERAKVWVDDLEFSDGTKTLPQVEREFGRDSKINGKKKKKKDEADDKL